MPKDEKILKESVSHSSANPLTEPNKALADRMNASKNKSLAGLLGGKKKFHEEVKTRYPFDERLVGKPLTLLDAFILEDFNGKYGQHDAGLMLFKYVGNDKTGKPVEITFSTIYSGVAILNQLKKIVRSNYFPVDVKVIVNREGMANQYLSFEVPESESLPMEEKPESFDNLPF